MATTTAAVHLYDSDRPTVTPIGLASVNIRFGEFSIFLTSAETCTIMLDALAQAAAIFMAQTETPGADETPGA